MELKEFIKGHTILDSNLISINIDNANNELKVIFMFKMKNGLTVKFTFKDVIEYNFYFSDKNTFYIVTDYILDRIDDSTFYVSLDPYNPLNGISNEDLDYVKSKHLSIEILNDSIN